MPTLAHDPAHSGGITLTPAADNDSLSMAYTDNNGIARILSAAKENGEWRITAAGTSASIDPASGTITLPPERILDNSTVRASGGQNGAQSAETTLRSNADNPPLEAYLFAASDAPVNEGDSAHYLIRLNRPAERDLTFNVRVSHKDTDAGDLDASAQTVTIRAGESHATFRIDTRDDTSAERIETYKVSITSADGGATVPDWKASLTGEIRDNDGTIAAPSVREGTDGTTITPAAGAQHIHITYQDNQFGNVTLNAWRDDNNRWHLSEVNPDKRTTAPTIDPDSGSVTLPSSILAAGGRVHAHNNDSQNSGAGGRNSAVAEYDGWKLDWHDTFDKSVEESGWTRYGWGWQTPEHGGMGRYQQSNAYTADGVLNIQNQYHNGAWTSVGISSGDTFAASGGRWEIRAKFSDAKGIGYAFLLWPKSENWPPEVDFAEGRVRDPNIMGTYHWGTAADHQQDNQYLRNADLTDWHTYGAIIDPDAGTITYTFDGKPWYTLKNVPATSEMMWLGMQTGSQDPNGSAAQSESIDNAIPGAHTPAASNIQIDWAAHYRKDDSAPPQPQQNHEGTVSITGEAKVGSTLTATVTDGDGFAADNVQYQWLRDGQPIDKANGSTYTLSKDDAGHKITVQATYKDNAGHDENPTSETTDIPTPPANQDGTITISGEAKVGSELTAHIHDQDGVPSSGVQYQWFANDQAIHGATGSRYTLTAAEKGKTITVQASYTDNADHSEQVQSEATVAVKDRIVLDVTDAAFGATANDQTDDTAAIQKAIDTAGNAGGGTVVIPSGTYLINAVAHKTSWGSGSSGLLMRDNVTVQMQPDTVLQAMTNDYKGYSIFTFNQVKNAKLSGGTLIGDRHTHIVHPGDVTVSRTIQDPDGTVRTIVEDSPVSDEANPGEWGHGVDIVSSQHIVVENVVAKDFWGDGFSITDSNLQPKTRTQDIVLNNVVADGNRRQGLSILDGEKIKVLHSEFKNTGGTLPGAGLDVEPEDGESVHDLEVAYTKFSGNANAAVLFLSEAGRSESITQVNFHHNTITGDNQGGGLYADGLSDSTIADNTIEHNSRYAVQLLPASSGNTVSNNKLTQNDGRIISLGDNRLTGDARDFAGYEANQPGSVSINGRTAVGQTLTAEVQDGNGFSDNTVFYYQWYADGVAITDAVRKTFTPNTAQLGKKISVSVTYYDHHANVEKISAEAEGIIDGNPTSNRAATIRINGETDDSGHLKQWQKLTTVIDDPDGLPPSNPDGIHEENGKYLTASGEEVNIFNARMDDNGNYVNDRGEPINRYGDPIIRYQWYADGEAIPGAIQSTFMPRENQACKTISVAAHYTDAGNHDETPHSVATPAVQNISNHKATITVSGKIAEGETLTVVVHDPDGIPANIHYQWYADGVAIDGAHSANYTIQAGDLGKILSVRTLSDDPATPENTEIPGFRDNYWYWENPLGIANPDQTHTQTTPQRDEADNRAPLLSGESAGLSQHDALPTLGDSDAPVHLSANLKASAQAELADKSSAEILDRLGERGRDAFTFDASETPHTLTGTDGNDNLVAVGGANTLKGGEGADQFIFITQPKGGDSPALNQILDLNSGEDRIRLVAGKGESISDLQYDADSRLLSYTLHDSENRSYHNSIVVNAHDGHTLTQEEVLAAVSIL